MRMDLNCQAALLLESYIFHWSEYVEMYPGQEWEFIAKNMAVELAKAYEQTVYYKRLGDAGISTKHS